MNNQIIPIQATPLLESGNLKALLDPKSGGDFDVVKMRRMVLAATLCIKQSARLRPKVSQVFKCDFIVMMIGIYF